MRLRPFIGLIRYRLNRCCVYCVIFVCIVLMANQLILQMNRRRGLITSQIFKERRKMAVRKTIETTIFENDPETSLINASENKTLYDLNYVGANVSFDPMDYDAKIDNGNEIPTKHARPTILLWNPLQFPSNSIPEIPLCGGGCEITSKREKFNKSDAVVFTMKEFNLTDLPNGLWRRSDQVFVWWTEESAWASKIMYQTSLKKVRNNYFNWSMTYKRDSDVNAMMIPYNARRFVQSRLKKSYGLNPIPFERKVFLGDVPLAIPKTQREVVTLKRQATQLLRRKVKTAVWIASNCGYTAAAVLRRDIVTKLQFVGLHVDIYGECGDTNIPVTLAEFAEMVSEYRFYLAFENALHCRDYITEKFWYNSLYSGAVPVVWGPMKSDVAAVAPPNSFIHYDDFKTDEDLVQYLVRLTKDDNEYMKYFAWWWETPAYFPIYGVTEMFDEIPNRRAMYDFEMNAFCHLCSLLNKGIHKKLSKSISSLHDWWYKDETKTCMSRTHGAKMKTYHGDSSKEGYQVVSA